MKEIGIICANALKLAGTWIKPGMSTYDLDMMINDYFRQNGAVSSSYNYHGFPGANCISINDELIHGIPSKTRIIKEGDIVSLDVCAHKNGFHADNAYTYAVGRVSDEAQRLLEVTKASLYKGIEMAVAGNRVGDVSHAIQQYVESHGYSVVRKFIGHGVGRNLHEAPDVPNFGTPGKGPRLIPGMTIAIEPMVNAEGEGVYVEKDGWTVKTVSRSLAAHFENIVLISKNGPVILTKSTV